MVESENTFLDWKPDALYNPQLILCPHCGKEISLTRPDEHDWSVYVVECQHCGRYGLESKYTLKSGAGCPRCGSKFAVGKRFVASQEMRALMASQGNPVYRFLEGRLVIRVDGESEE